MILFGETFGISPPFSIPLPLERRGWLGPVRSSGPLRGHRPAPFSVFSRPIHRSGRAAVVPADVGPCSPREGGALRWLDESEQARRSRFVRSGPRQDFKLRHAFLRALLCREPDCGSEALSPEAFDHGQSFRTDRRISRARLIRRQPQRAVWPDRDGEVDVEGRTAPYKVDGDPRLVVASGEQAGFVSVERNGKTDLSCYLWNTQEVRVKVVGVGLRLDTASFEIPSAKRHGQTSCLACLPVAPAVQGRLERLAERRFAATLAVEELAASSAGDCGRPPFAWTA